MPTTATGLTGVAPPPSSAPTPVRPARGRQFLRALLAPARWARRRPGRAFLVAVGAAGASYALFALGVALWFEYHLRAARAELDAVHNSRAVHHLRACQWARPLDREVLVLTARAARRSGTMDEGEALLDQYWQRYGDEPPLVLERLLYRGARGELEGVGQALAARIRAGGPDARLAREAYVAGLTFRFRWLEARLFLDEWLAATPDDTLALLQMGKFQEQQQALDEATRTYRRILELDPEHLEVRLRLATLFVSRRYGAEAAAQLDVLRERLPGHPEVLILWSRAQALLGQTEGARRAVDECLAAHPDYPAALLERGNAALLDGDEAYAERCLAQAARLDPGNIQAHNQYALVLGRRGKPAEAAAEYARAKQLEVDGERMTQIIRGPLQERPNDPALHHEIGMIALRSGLASEALRWFTSALHANPDHLETHRVLVNVYRELDNPALAAKHRAIAQKLSAQPGRR